MAWDEGYSALPNPLDTVGESRLLDTYMDAANAGQMTIQEAVQSWRAACARLTGGSALSLAAFEGVINTESIHKLPDEVVLGEMDNLEEN